MLYRLFRSRLMERLIDDGRVPCPIRKSDAEVDVCAACPWLIELNEHAASPYVLCSSRTLSTALQHVINPHLASGNF